MKGIDDCRKRTHERLIIAFKMCNCTSDKIKYMLQNKNKKIRKKKKLRSLQERKGIADSMVYIYL